MTSESVRPPLRADALRNRRKILAAAREVFAARGLEVSLDEIATAAGVGATTVTRRFPDRDALIEALFEEELNANVAEARMALTAEDAGDGLVRFLRSMLTRAGTDRGIAQVVLSDRYGLDGTAARRQELSGLILELVERARAEGRVRQGVRASDIPLLMLMVGSVADFSAVTDPQLWRRYAEVLVDSVVPSGRDDIWVGSALTPLQLAEAMAAWKIPGR